MTIPLKSILRTWVDAFNRTDIDALVDLYHDNAVYHQVNQDPIEGRDAIRRDFELLFNEAEMVCIVENMFEDGDWALIDWRDPIGLRFCVFFHLLE